MASLQKWAKTAVRRAPPPPLRLASTGFDSINDAQTFEEEQFDGFKKVLYYPINIGDVLISKYQVLGKLVYGLSSTVLLARDLQAHEHVALKIYIRDGDPLEEFKIYQQLGNIGKWIAEVPIPQGMNLEKSEMRLEGKNQEVFLQIMRGMLQWRPKDRKTAKQMLEEP
ncbi:hypothetical protein BPAE_0027g00030 [Botrytis paeoniae]|uniref:non-specific serine/threonine protein kinase n=1 Tax=Botrytis paeoniae TaxID=278948 RepID=A0A4Z1FUQ3_9HELO|nr:hypothetical protein BPAE_0027g00030 [Botrytis paeoniae]